MFNSFLITSEFISSTIFSQFIIALNIFILAVIVGYYVIWKVTPSLHSPLMALTNAISSIIIVGGLLSTGLSEVGVTKIMGFVVVFLSSINIFGGFMITYRMLRMF